MNKTYLAITIGPIYETIKAEKRTRAMWAASYFFSWFMKQFISLAKEKNLNILLPYSDEIFESTYGSGLYADRAYFIKDEHTTEAIINEIFQSIIDQVNERYNYISQEFLSNYLNLHIIERSIGNEDLKDSYPLEILNRELDRIELKKHYVFDIESNPLHDLFTEKTSDNFIAKDAFDNHKERKFISLGEITTTSLRRQNKSLYDKIVLKGFKNEDIELIDTLEKTLKDQFKPQHKYYGVIYADGDNIGKVLQQIDAKGLDLHLFSKALFEFGIETEKKLEEYGGKGIYLGGEDILAFVPVSCISKDLNHNETIFSLVKNIDKVFDKTVCEYCRNNDMTLPSMSYGIMISYYKFPMKEAMEKAYHQLDEVAKKEDGKNTIAIKFQKHSGQYFDCMINKNNINSLKSLYHLVNQYSQNLNEKSQEILSSIVHKFSDETFVELYLNALKNGHLEYFFENYFNENIHKESNKSIFLNDVKSLSESIYTEYYTHPDKLKNILYMVLRFVLFINSDKD